MPLSDAHELTRNQEESNCFLSSTTSNNLVKSQVHEYTVNASEVEESEYM